MQGDLGVPFSVIIICLPVIALNSYSPLQLFTSICQFLTQCLKEVIKNKINYDQYKHTNG